VSSDWGPIYDRTDLDGFFAARGTSGNQFKNACVGSNLMAELITAVSNGHDHDDDPLVVTARYTGAELNMGEFSRNRLINPDSTGTTPSLSALALLAVRSPTSYRSAAGEHSTSTKPRPPVRARRSTRAPSSALAIRRPRAFGLLGKARSTGRTGRTT